MALPLAPLPLALLALAPESVVLPLLLLPLLVLLLALTPAESARLAPRPLLLPSLAEAPALLAAAQPAAPPALLALAPRSAWPEAAVVLPPAPSSTQTGQNASLRFAELLAGLVAVALPSKSLHAAAFHLAAGFLVMPNDDGSMLV